MGPLPTRPSASASHPRAWIGYGYLPAPAQLSCLACAEQTRMRCGRPARGFGPWHPRCFGDVVWHFSLLIAAGVLLLPVQTVFEFSKRFRLRLRDQQNQAGIKQAQPVLQKQITRRINKNHYVISSRGYTQDYLRIKTESSRDLQKSKRD